MENPLKILMLEDSVIDAAIVQEAVTKEKPGCEFKLVMNEDDYLQALDQYQPDLILSDNTLPQFDATKALEIYNQRSLSIPFILVTGTVSEEFAAGIIKLGADDYILKDRLTRLPAAIDAALKQRWAESERKKAEDKIRFKANLLNTVGQAVIATDLKGIVSYWNNAAEKIYGWPPEEAIGKNIIELTPAQQSKEQAVEIMDELNKGNVWSGEFLVQRKDGTVFPAFVTDSPIYDQEGQLTGIIGVSFDISERKKAEEDLRSMENKIQEQKIQEQKKIARAIIKAQEEEKNRIGQELHDNINQILAGTKIYLSVAGKKNDELKELIKYPMELIDSSIEEIRLLSRKQVTPLKNIDLEVLVRELLSNLDQNATPQVNLNYSVSNGSLSDDLKLSIYRIIQEQLNNILKHADAKNVTIAIKTHDKTISINVEDDGKGFNVKNKRKGIGISNMINRVETFNGWVEIRSNPGEGCKINVSIPY